MKRNFVKIKVLVNDRKQQEKPTNYTKTPLKTKHMLYTLNSKLAGFKGMSKEQTCRIKLNIRERLMY